MHRIDSDGHASNLFTEGNAALLVPATVVSAAIMNALQEEVCEVIEDVGIALLTSGTDTRNQLLAAIKELIKRGGAAAAINQTIANNQSSAADVTGFGVFLTTEILAIEFFFRIQRSTDSSNMVESGRCYLTWNSIEEEWEVSVSSVHGDAGVVFEVNPTGEDDEYELQYTSDNLAGSSYAGNLKITDIKVILV